MRPRRALPPLVGGAWGCWLVAWLASPAVARSAGPSPSVVMAAVGDILLARGVQRAVLSDHGRLAGDLGKRLRHVRAALDGADIAFGNLECPLSAGGVSVPKLYSFRANPVMTELLQESGFTVLSLANNHTLDCSKSGLVDTMHALTNAGIAFVGAGPDLRAARTALVVERQGLRVAFLAYSDFPPEGIVLVPDRPGIALASASVVSADVHAAAAAADVVIVSFHGGREYADHPSRRQRAFVDAAVKAGADVVLGHHPHVLQPFEWRRKRRGRRAFIAWSLGNFLFDSHRPAARDTAVLRLTLTKRGAVDAALVPMIIDHCFPRPADPREASRLIARLQRASLSCSFAPRSGSPPGSFGVLPATR